MIKINKDFFLDNEVLFVGYSSEGSKNAPFGKSVYQAFRKNGIKVVPFNAKENATYDQKVYSRLDDLPSLPKTAYFMINKNHASAMVDHLASRGVKRILFQNKTNVDAQTLERCTSLGIEAVAVCPMMIFGTGFHKFHAFIAGVRK